jgi:hypothetical protein
MVPDKQSSCERCQVDCWLLLHNSLRKRLKSRARTGITEFAYCLLVISRLLVILRYKIYYIRCWHLGVGLDKSITNLHFLRSLLAHRAKTELQKI